MIYWPGTRCPRSNESGSMYVGTAAVPSWSCSCLGGGVYSHSVCIFGRGCAWLLRGLLFLLSTVDSCPPLVLTFATPLLFRQRTTSVSLSSASSTRSLRWPTPPLPTFLTSRLPHGRLQQRPPLPAGLPPLLPWVRLLCCRSSTRVTRRLASFTSEALCPSPVRGCYPMKMALLMSWTGTRPKGKSLRRLGGGSLMLTRHLRPR